jgi:hypothetical protein
MPPSLKQQIMKENIPVFNISDLDNKVLVMRTAIDVLSRTPSMGIIVTHLISTFIDSLAYYHKMSFEEYLNAHFPDVCTSIGADKFRTHIRNKAVHELAVKPPIGLAYSFQLDNGEAYTEETEINGQNWTLLNVDRLAKDFLEHLKTL